MRAILLQCSVDLPARAVVMNMKQFNGEFGCLYCEAEGRTPPGDHLHRYWPPSSRGPAHSHETLLENAQETISIGDAVSVFGNQYYFLHGIDINNIMAF